MDNAPRPSERAARVDTTPSVPRPDPAELYRDLCPPDVDLAPAILAWLEWSGGEMPAHPFVQVMIRLLSPKGMGRGVRLPDSAEELAGFSIEEVVRGIEAFHLANHHSPASLAKHVAGQMVAAGPGASGAAGGAARMLTYDEALQTAQKQGLKFQQLRTAKGPDGKVWAADPRDRDLPFPPGYTSITQAAPAAASVG